MSRNKNKLSIVIRPEDSLQNIQEGEKDNWKLKRISSVRNIKQSTTSFDFDHPPPQMNLSKKGKQIQRNNQLLYKYLVALKTGAVSALLQKQEEIDHLKSQHQMEEQVKIIEDELRSLIEEQNELKSEVSFLEDKLLSEREGYERMFEEKEKVIEQLYAQLGQTQMQMETLEKSCQVKQKKIKIIEEQNSSLFQQLQEEKIYNLGRVSTHVDSEEPQQTVKYVVMEKQNQAIEEESNSVSINSSTYREIEQRHRQEFQELSIFYEKRFSEIRQLYEKELMLVESRQKEEINWEQNKQRPNSFRETQISPKKLSNELPNCGNISDCYSLTDKNQSKIDCISIFSREKGESLYCASNFKFRLKPVSQQISKISEQDKSDEKNNKFMNPLQKRSSVCRKNEQKKPFQLGSFLLGAVTGGTLATLACKFIS